MPNTIPDIPRCLELMDTFAMWENIRHHSFLVARVAGLLQRRLQDLGSAANVPPHNLVVAGALLHDIAKSKCLEEECRHAEVGAAICEDLGYPEVADIVANHVVLPEFVPERYARGDFKAMELVFYADKRVKHDQVVDLDQRLAYILDKYADHQRHEELIMKNFQACRLLEQQLFAHLDFPATELETVIASESAGMLCYPPQAPLPQPA